MASASLYCTVCGAANQPGASFCFACGQSLQAVPHINTGELATDAMLQQRYRILVRLGSGGFGAVYKVADTKLGDRMLAVKEMSQSGLKPQEAADATEAFKREALMLAGLMHPSLPRIYDHFDEMGRWYLVMDFIEGETLEVYLDKRGGKLPLEEVLQIGIQLCDVLGYLHTRQPPIIFRDLKPANSMITPDGALYLIDFGIARHFKPGQAKDTIAFGSPGYAAPEQYGKAQTTARADIYSLGATLHQLLTGNDPSESPFTFAPPRTIPALGQLIMHMVNVDTSKRPASIAEVKQELQRITTQLNNGVQSAIGQAASPPYPPYNASPAIYQSAQGIIPTSDAALVKYSLHTDKIRCVAWSPDGTRIASASSDMKTQVWEAASGDTICRYRGHVATVWTVAWSPDGTRVASGGSDATIQIWKADTGEALFKYTGHSATAWAVVPEVRTVAWSPDGTRIASGGSDNTVVQVWEAP